MAKIVKWGLLHKPSGQLLGFWAALNYCESGVEFFLTKPSEGVAPWLVDSRKEAEQARTPGDDGFSYEGPVNKFKPEELEVVEVSVSFG